MIAVCIPRRLIIRSGLIAPHVPAIAVTSRKQLDEWARRAFFYDRDDFIRFSGVLALLRSDEVDLRPCRGKGSVVLAANAKQEDFSHVAEVEADTTAVRASILSDLFPYDITLVFKSPSLHDR